MTSLSQALLKAWRHRGPLAWGLAPVASLMWLVVTLRRLASAQGWLRAERLSVPVLVVGNRIVGGAGKTPTTVAIVAHLQARGLRPGVLSRGYGVRIEANLPRLLDAHTAAGLSASDTGDEPWLIHRRTGAPVMVGPHRATSGRALLLAHPDIDILVCDDGLQHLALQRDIEVIVFDERGAGNGWLMPAGPLREPLHTAPGPGVTAPPLVVYNAAQPSTALPGHIGRRELGELRALGDWWSGRHTQSPPSPADTPGVWAVAGIAHPPRFFDALTAQGWSLHTCALPDHTDFATLPWPADVRHVIVTEKDAVKLTPSRVRSERPDTQVWVSVLDFRLPPSFWAALDERVDAALASRPALPR